MVIQRNNIGEAEVPFAIEQALLRRLCETGIASLAQEALESLIRHSWTVPDHRVIFEALVRIGSLPTALLRERLPAEATRLGFPDVDWSTFFAPPGPSADSPRATLELIADLVSASKLE
jgi:hypothetical protein